MLSASSVPPVSASRTVQTRSSGADTRPRGISVISSGIVLEMVRKSPHKQKPHFQPLSPSAAGQQRGWQQRERRILTARRPLLVRTAAFTTSYNVSIVTAGVCAKYGH